MTVYATATAFRQALEGRLNSLASREGIDVLRLRRQVAFDRLLCRLFHESRSPWVLKGGYAMELRLVESRATRDIDLMTRRPIRGSGSLDERILTVLQDAAATDLGDYFSFAVGQSSKDLAGAPYGGARYPVEARMDGRSFARFHLDVASGDPVLEPLEIVQGRDWLDFAGIPRSGFPAISKEQQFAEKLHAYTRPRRTAPNSRVRDLLDMLLLIRLGLDPGRTHLALIKIFARYKTHKLPTRLQSPPDDWARPFAALAEECSANPDLNVAFEVVQESFVSLVSGRSA